MKKLSEMTEAEANDYMNAANAVVRSAIPPGASFFLLVRDPGTDIALITNGGYPVDPAAARRFADSLARG